MNAIRKVLKKQKGFTLIELLIVIAIIGVLAVLIIPRVMNSLGDAESKTGTANIKLIQSAVERYYFEENKYPTSDGSENGNIIFEGPGGLVTKKYIDKNPGGNYKLEDGVVESGTYTAPPAGG